MSATRFASGLWPMSFNHMKSASSRGEEVAFEGNESEAVAHAALAVQDKKCSYFLWVVCCQYAYGMGEATV